MSIARRGVEDSSNLIDLNRVREGARRILIFHKNQQNKEKFYFGLAEFYCGVSSLYIACQPDSVKDESKYRNTFELRSEKFDRLRYSHLKEK